MNSIRRPRRHPRVRSVCWQTFGWVLVREAVATILAEWEPIGPDVARRSWLRDSRTDHVRFFGERYLARHPERRYCP